MNASTRASARPQRSFLGIQAAFVDKHLRNVSERYDFDTFRIGIQPFSSDFRGFLFQDSQLGVRLFGTRDNNRWQYNLAWFRRLEKDTNSGLNDLGQRCATTTCSSPTCTGRTCRCRASPRRRRWSTTATARTTDAYYNENGFIERPASHRAPAAAARVRRDLPRLQRRRPLRPLNLTPRSTTRSARRRPACSCRRQSTSARSSPRPSCRCDFDWIRPRISLLYGSATTIRSTTSRRASMRSSRTRCSRAPTPATGSARRAADRRRRVALSGRNGVLTSLRSSKEEGQSNFTNPGILLAGSAWTSTCCRQLRVLNANYAVLRRDRGARGGAQPGRIDKDIGYDVSAALTWRPLMSRTSCCGVVRDAAGRRRLRCAVPGRRSGLLPCSERDLQLLRGPMKKLFAIVHHARWRAGARAAASPALEHAVERDRHRPPRRREAAAGRGRRAPAA